MFPDSTSSKSVPHRNEALGGHFLARLLDAVILLVVIRSPMYFCRNLLLLSSLSCSSLTASILLKRVTRESCSARACLLRCQPILSSVRSTSSNSPLQLLSRLLAHRLNILARPPGAHGPDIVWLEMQFNWPNICRIARDDHGAAALAAR